jgi:hypothetical protein
VARPSGVFVGTERRLSASVDAEFLRAAESAVEEASHGVIGDPGSPGR